jgi:hypothetical protein
VRQALIVAPSQRVPGDSKRFGIGRYLLTFAIGFLRASVSAQVSSPSANI